jgi:hypothetical protein
MFSPFLHPIRVVPSDQEVSRSIKDYQSTKYGRASMVSIISSDSKVLMGHARNILGTC